MKLWGLKDSDLCPYGHIQTIEQVLYDCAVAGYDVPSLTLTTHSWSNIVSFEQLWLIYEILITTVLFIFRYFFNVIGYFLSIFDVCLCLPSRYHGSARF